MAPCTDDDSPSGIETAVCAFFTNICALLNCFFRFEFTNTKDHLAFFTFYTWHEFLLEEIKLLNIINSLLNCFKFFLVTILAYYQKYTRYIADFFYLIQVVQLKVPYARSSPPESSSTWLSLWRDAYYLYIGRNKLSKISV